MTNKKYRKHNGQFARKYEGIPMLIGYIILALMFGIWAWVSINKYVNRNPLVSPVAQVHAKESVIVSCENPRGYLECQVHKGKITWEDHRKLSKIIDCESKWNTNAINVNKDGSVDRGIFQVNNKYHPTLTNEKAFDFKANIDYGISLYKRNGVRPWVCSRILNIK